MQKRLIEKLAENKRRLLMSEIKEKLVPCAERGFTYRFADLAQSRQLLKLVLSNSIPANTREVDALEKTETKQLIWKISQSYVAYDDRDVLLFHQYSSEIGALVCSFGKCLEHLDCLLECIEFDEGILNHSFILVEPECQFGLCVLHTEYGCVLVYW
ncbi:YxiF family protein [Bacillus sp. FSL R7-0685]|uniref:YxiF family protein n=1 Tax=Bacillus sp. FSL R7-0685 TaxID=2921589 RepID=UPI0030F4CFCA